MKKHSVLMMLSLFTTFLATSLLGVKSSFNAADAEEIIAAPITIQIRSGGSNNNYLVILDENIDPYGASIGVSNYANYNAPNYINIYTSKDSGPIALSTIIDSKEWKVNLWQSRGVLFPISDTTYQTYNGASIYAVEILEGCTYPNAMLQSMKISKSKRYVNQNYGNEAYKNESFSWIESAAHIDFEPSDEIIELYGAQLRGAPESDLYYFCLSSSSYYDQTYQEYIDIDVLNAYSKIKLYLSKDDLGKTLGEITSNSTGCQNRWSSSSFHFALNSDEYEIYNGSSVYKISIEEGTQLILNEKIVSVKQSYVFKNAHYQDDEYKYGSFEFFPTIEPSDQTIDLFGAEVRADPGDGLYFIDVKSSLYLNNPVIEYPDVSTYINAYDKIIIYLSEEDEGHTLGEITSLRNAIQNKWESQAFMFYLTAEEYEIYNGTTIYRIVVLDDCELIYGNKICKVSKGVDLMNVDYGKESARNSAFNFLPYIPPIEEPISIQGAQVRGDVDLELFYIDFISDVYFGVDEAEFPDLTNINAYSYIKVFLNKDDEGTLLKDVTSLRSGCQNKWESFAFLFRLTKEEYEIYNGTTIYALEIYEETELLVSGAKATVDKNYRFINSDYGKASAKYEAFNFQLEAAELKDLGKVSMMNIHNRMDKDSGHRWIMFLFEENIYDVNVNVSNWIDRLNFLDNILIYESQDKKPYSLRDIYNPNEDGVTLRMFGERNMLGISILNDKENGEYLYSGNKMYMIQINEGTQMPTYENGETGYRIITEKIILKNNEYDMTGDIPNTIDDYGNPRKYEEWNLNWTIIRCYATFTVVGIEGLSFPDMNLEPGQRISLDYFKQEGYDLEVTTKDGEKVYQYIIGSNHNIDFILTYTPASKKPETKKGCGGEITTSSLVIVPATFAISLITLIALKKKEGETL